MSDLRSTPDPDALYEVIVDEDDPVVLWQAPLKMIENTVRNDIKLVRHGDTDEFSIYFVRDVLLVRPVRASSPEA